MEVISWCFFLGGRLGGGLGRWHLRTKAALRLFKWRETQAVFSNIAKEDFKGILIDAIDQERWEVRDFQVIYVFVYQGRVLFFFKDDQKMRLHSWKCWNQIQLVVCDLFSGTLQLGLRKKEPNISSWPKLPETNIATENQWWEDEFPLGKAFFRGYVSFRECKTRWFFFFKASWKTWRNNKNMPLTSRKLDNFIFLGGCEWSGKLKGNFFSKFWYLAPLGSKKNRGEILRQKYMTSQWLKKGFLQICSKEVLFFGWRTVPSQSKHPGQLPGSSRSRRSWSAICAWSSLCQSVGGWKILCQKKVDETFFVAGLVGCLFTWKKSSAIFLKKSWCFFCFGNPGGSFLEVVKKGKFPKETPKKNIPTWSPQSTITYELPLWSVFWTRSR